MNTSKNSAPRQSAAVPLPSRRSFKTSRFESSTGNLKESSGRSPNRNIPLSERFGSPKQVSIPTSNGFLSVFSLNSPFSHATSKKLPQTASADTLVLQRFSVPRTLNATEHSYHCTSNYDSKKQFTAATDPKTPTDMYVRTSGKDVFENNKGFYTGLTGLHKASMNYPAVTDTHHTAFSPVSNENLLVIQAYQNFEVRIVGIGLRSFSPSIGRKLINLVNSDAGSACSYRRPDELDKVISPRINFIIKSSTSQECGLSYDTGDMKHEAAPRNMRSALFGGSKYRLQLLVNRSIFIPLQNPMNSSAALEQPPLELHLTVETENGEQMGNALLRTPLVIQQGVWNLPLTSAKVTAENVERQSLAVHSVSPQPDGNRPQPAVLSFPLSKQPCSVRNLSSNNASSRKTLEEITAAGKVYVRFMGVTAPKNSVANDITPDSNLLDGLKEHLETGIEQVYDDTAQPGNRWNNKTCHRQPMEFSLPIKQQREANNSGGETRRETVHHHHHHHHSSGSATTRSSVGDMLLTHGSFSSISGTDKSPSYVNTQEGYTLPKINCKPETPLIHSARRRSKSQKRSSKLSEAFAMASVSTSSVYPFQDAIIWKSKDAVGAMSNVSDHETDPPQNRSALQDSKSKTSGKESFAASNLGNNTLSSPVRCQPNSQHFVRVRKPKDMDSVVSSGVGSSFFSIVNSTVSPRRRNR